MKVCLNGHVLTDCLEISSSAIHKFCESCGAALIENCITCNARIPGSYPGVIGCTHATPNFCCQCGTPYPWTPKTEMIGKIREAIELDAKLDPSEKTDIKDQIDKFGKGKCSPEEEVKLGKRISQLSTKAWEVARPVLSAVFTEAAKKTLGL